MILNNTVKKVYMNADGSSTPNLDFINNKIAMLNKDLDASNNRINEYKAQYTAWQREINRLKGVLENTLLPAKRQGLQAEIDKATARRNDYTRLIDAENVKNKAIVDERALMLKALSDYQASVALNISQGGSDVDSTAIAENELGKILGGKSNKKLLLYGGIGLGVIVVTFVGIKMLK